MAAATIKYRFLLRGGAADAIAALNEIPLSRELVVETDTLKMKLGDGVTHYNDLVYLSSGESFDLLQAYLDAPERAASAGARILTMQDGALASVLLDSISGSSDAADVTYNGGIPGTTVKDALDNVAASFDAIGRQSITAGTALAAGQFVYVAADELAYPADYRSSDTAASMYVLTAIASGDSGTAFTGSANSALSGLLPGSWYALGVAGAVSLVADLSAASGTVLQILGTATSSTSLAVSIQPAILRG